MRAPRRGAAVLGLLASACSGGPELAPGQPDAVVLIVVDTLRADHLGFHGYPQAHTPRLDAFAATGRVFGQAMAAVPVTLPSVSSMLTGRYPQRHGVRDNGGFVLPGEELTLAERFAAAGWRSSAVVASQVLARGTGIEQGFDRFDDDTQPGYPVYDPRLEPLAEELGASRRRADAVTDRALAELERLGDAPFFLLVHYFDPHSYYDPPPRFGELHPKRPYDGEISFVDHEIGRLLDALAERRPRALVAFTADHGEGLGEHGEAEHGFLLYQSTLHVPLVLAGPGVEPGRTDVPVSLVDLEPTLAALAQLPAATGPARDGVGLPVDGSAPPAGRPLYAETLRTLLSYQWAPLRALRQGSNKLVHGPEDQLLDLATDPGEEQELDPALPPGPVLRARLDSMVAGDDLAAVLERATGGMDPERVELLASLGYVGGAAPSGGLELPELPHPEEALPRWTARQVAKADYRAAIALIEQGRPAEARERLDELLARHPGYAPAWYSRALLRRAAGEGAGAWEDLRNAIEADSTFVPALELVANELLRAGAVEPALPQLRRWVDAAPEDPDARYQYGVALRKTGRAVEALPVLAEFLRLAPADDPRRPSVERAIASGGDR